MFDHHIHVEILGVPILVYKHDFASAAAAGKMNAYGRRRTGKVSRHKRTEHVVDSASAISGSIPDGLKTLNLSISLDDRTVYLDDPGERRIGYRSNEDAACTLG